MIRVFVEGNNPSIEKMFNNESFYICVDTVEEADLVCFTGGSDVSPELYWEKNTSSNTNPSRDVYCIGLYFKAQDLGIPCVGICRGGQFLNVMNGGSLIQDINGHAINHTHSVNVVSEDYGLDFTFQATSTHHQAIVPNFTEEPTIFGKSTDDVYEVVLYEDTDVWDLCFQPHPEYNVKSTRDAFFNLLEALV